MPVYLLTDKIAFPPPELARKDGLLAVGGDLSAPRLILAYRMGIFPWYNPGSPILWWSPDPRLVLKPGKIHISRRFKRFLRKNPFRTTFDRGFEQVIRACAESRTFSGEGTWLTPEMIDAYTELHHLGYAHSVETWFGGELAGGIYGLALGSVFFGESMFMRMSNASKTALVALALRLEKWKFHFMDCQVITTHMMRMGAEEINRPKFLELLKKGIETPSLAPEGRWGQTVPRGPEANGRFSAA